MKYQRISMQSAICHLNSFVKLNPSDFRIMPVYNYSINSVVRSTLESFVDLSFIQCDR